MSATDPCRRARRVRARGRSRRGHGRAWTRAQQRSARDVMRRTNGAGTIDRTLPPALRHALVLADAPGACGHRARRAGDRDLVDRALVDQLGLSVVAEAVQAETARAGRARRRTSAPRRWRASSGCASRSAWPRGDRAFTRDGITRAEAAWSFVEALHFNGFEQAYDRQVFLQYQLPALTPASAAAALGGEQDRDARRGARRDRHHARRRRAAGARRPTAQARWRVFKLSGNPAGRSISGRTAADQAGEIPKSRRIPFDGIAPGRSAVLGRGDQLRPGGIDREGIVLPGEFMINASGRGVYVSPWFDAATQRVHVGASGRLLSAGVAAGEARSRSSWTW